MQNLTKKYFLGKYKALKISRKKLRLANEKEMRKFADK